MLRDRVGLWGVWAGPGAALGDPVGLFPLRISRCPVRKNTRREPSSGAAGQGSPGLSLSGPSQSHLDTSLWLQVTLPGQGGT